MLKFFRKPIFARLGAGLVMLVSCQPEAQVELLEELSYDDKLEILKNEVHSSITTFDPSSSKGDVVAIEPLDVKFESILSNGKLSDEEKHQQLLLVADSEEERFAVDAAKVIIDAIKADATSNRGPSDAWVGANLVCGATSIFIGTLAWWCPICAGLAAGLVCSWLLH